VNITIKKRTGLFKIKIQPAATGISTWFEESNFPADSRVEKTVVVLDWTFAWRTAHYLGLLAAGVFRVPDR